MTKALISLLLVGVFFVGPVEAQVAGSATAAAADQVLLILKSDRLDDTKATIDAIRAAGGSVGHVIVPRTLIATIPFEIEADILDIPNIEELYRDAVPDGDIAGYSGATAGIDAWNHLINPPPTAAFDSLTAPTPLIGDAEEPDPPSFSSEFMTLSSAPGYDQTSEFLAGDVAVGVIIPESIGDLENWSPSRQTTVFNEIVQGLSWWAWEAPAATNLTFYYEQHFDVPTQYEPITMSAKGSERREWVRDIYGNMGYTTGGHKDRGWAFANDLRDRLGTDWAFSFIVIDSYVDPDGAFTDGYFAMALMGGPYSFMTYDNDGWGIAYMDTVAAHEMGHIFLAADEYCQPDYACCTFQNYGYLDVYNANCEDGNPASVPCVMKNNDYVICEHTIGQIGWRDTDLDEIPDTLDNVVENTLDPHESPTEQLSLTFTGSAWEVPCFSPTRVNVTINDIAAVHFRVDQGPWLSASAADGDFDEDVEDYTFTTGQLTPSVVHRIETRARSSSGNFSAIAWQDIVVLSDSIWHVDADAAPGGDGTSWANAHKYLQDALAAALWNDEIRVAGGVYRPDQGGGETPGDRQAAFRLKNRVTLYGGYAGYGAPDPNARDIQLYETILSGDIGTLIESNDNSYHVVDGSDINATAVLDGFTITAGNADGSGANDSGGGMYNLDSSPTLTNCTFSVNWANNDGGGMYNDNSSPTLTNCTFSGNSASNGGGMGNWDGSSPTVSNCTFAGNSATNGNALACDSTGHADPSAVVIDNCILWDGGGEIWNNDGSTVTVSYSNVEGGWGGTGNIDTDPDFADADGQDNIVGTQDDNLHLLSISLCIDVGDPASDYGNEPQPNGNRINMGAYGNTDAASISSLDLDEDGITNPWEIFLGLNPNSADGDDDGLLDGFEVCYDGDCSSYDPYDPGTGQGGDLNVDSDDTDGDAMTDQWEVQYFDVVSPIDETDADIDSDSDGFSNIEEFFHNSLPNNIGSIPQPLIFYVDGDATGANDGTGWANAFTDLRDVLRGAISNDMILVAEGTYKPEGIGGDRTATFQLKNRAVVYGGYAGYGEPDPNARDIERYETILSGDLNGNDGLDFVNNSENSYHVVTGSGTGEMTVLDGFTITGGNANGSNPHDSGGGMYSSSGSPTVTNCTFTGNLATWGGGICNDSSSPTVANCAFVGNGAQFDGGAMFNSNNNPTVISCTFSGNVAQDRGGGMFNRSSSSPTVINCILWGNTASNGNEINNDNSTPVISYCDIADSGGSSSWDPNMGTDDGGNIDVDPLFIDPSGYDGLAGTEDDNLRLLSGSPCIDAGNNAVVNVTTDLDGRSRFVDGDSDSTATVDMGAYEYGPLTIYVDADATGANDGTSWTDAFNYLYDAMRKSVYDDDILVADGNYLPDLAGLGNQRKATFQLISGVAMYGGYAGYGASDPNARDIKLYETILSGDIGTLIDLNDNCYHVVTGNKTDETAVLDGFTITGGNANGSAPDDAGGGMSNRESGSPTVANCIFSGNLAGKEGGGMFNRDNCSPTVISCTFSGNSAVYGGGMYNREYSSPTLISCIFSGNSAVYGGGMYNREYCSPTMTNCTSTGNSAQLFGGGIFNIKFNSLTMSNCIIWGNTASSIGNEIYNTGTVVISYCDIAGCGGSGGGWDTSLGTDRGGNIDVDPLFVDADGADDMPGTEDDNLHLMGISPCINAGDPGGDYTGLVDMDGEARVRYGRVDIGVDEVYPIAGDFEPDEDVDVADFAVFALHWAQIGCNAGNDWCGGADMDHVDDVDVKDIRHFAEQWLAGAGP